MPAPIQLYNSLSNQLEALHTREEGKVAMYVCGMTVYDYCHIGHARAMLTFDLVVRHLRHRGYEVNYVRNHTDVDDKIIVRANELGEDPFGLAARYIDDFQKHLGDLNVKPPTIMPRATQEIENIIDMDSRLIDNGYAYAVDGDVYFRVRKDDDYGRLSRRKLEDMRAGARIEVDARKEDPLDFAIWKALPNDLTTVR